MTREQVTKCNRECKTDIHNNSNTQITNYKTSLSQRQC